MNKRWLSLMIIFISASFLTGCIRLVGTAGYSYKSPEDEALKKKQVSLDTNRLVPGSVASKPNIEI